MRRARALDGNRQPASDRGADGIAPRSTPLTLVSGAIAGGDLAGIATTVADALECPVAIAIPALGEPVVAPPASLAPDATRRIAAHAGAVIAGGNGDSGSAPAEIADAVAVRIGEQIVGIVAAAVPAGGDPSALTDASGHERHGWLEAAAAAASVTALIRDASGSPGELGAILLAELAAGPPQDLDALLGRARRIGIDLGGGAVAVSGRGGLGVPVGSVPEAPGALIAELGSGRVIGVVPLAGAGHAGAVEELSAVLGARGMAVGVSAPRRDPALLHEAVREAELLAELGVAPLALASGGQDETYRLLIGVLLRDRSELEQLRDRTITPLSDYDGRHDTELLGTLQAFLAHDGSTTETADAMSLHRHTVGYRLSRVHEVSGLSPYESDGRELLSLGLKAHHILSAERQLDAEL